MAGWIKLSREITGHWLWDGEGFSKGQAWIDLLLNANHAKAKISIKHQLIELEVGDQARSEVTLGKSWGWSRDKVRRFLKLLKKEGMIEQRTTHLTSVISICNYSKYQKGDTADNTADNTPDDTANLHRPDSRQYTVKNVKNGENEKNGDKPARTPSCPHQKIADLYNKIIPHPHPRVESMGSKDRMRLSKAMFKSMNNDLANVERYFGFLAENMKPFHKGENDRGWIADIEYMMRDSVIIKARENNL